MTQIMQDLVKILLLPENIKLSQICEMKKEKMEKSRELEPIARDLVKNVWENFRLLKSSSSDLSRASRKYGSEILCQTVLYLCGVELGMELSQQKWSRNQISSQSSDSNEWVTILTEILEQESRIDTDLNVLQALATAFSIEAWKNLQPCWHNFVKLSDKINLSESVGLTRMLMIIALLGCDAKRSGIELLYY